MAKNLTKGQSIAGLLFGIGCIWFLAAHSDEPSPKHDAPMQTGAPMSDDSTAPAPTQPEVPDTKPELVTLPEAIASSLPAMTDTVNETSAGAATFAMWAAAAPLRWGDLTALPKTKAALVFKDPDEQRGKLLCVAGEIIEITADRAAGKKIYQGGLGDLSRGTIYRFIAIGSTGELVQGSRGAFCGVVTGKFDYSNSAGGVTHAIQLVGMFKLPQNVNARQAKE